MKRIFAAVCVFLAAFGAAAAQDDVPAFDARLTQYDYPFEVAFLPLRSQRQELEMAYMHIPAKGDAPTVMLLHGKNFTAAYWKTTADYLASEGYGVLMPDQIGFGKSSKPDNYQYSFNQLAANTAALLDHLNIDSVIVAGHSMGGMVASRFALAYPGRVQKLILVNPIGLEDYLDYTTYPPIDAAFEREKQQTAQGIIDYQRSNYYDGEWKPEYEALTIPLQGWLKGPDAERLAYVAALTTDMILTQPVIDDFSTLKPPVTLIIGVRDRTAPNRANRREGADYELGRYDRLGKTVAKRLPKATLIELDGVGHLPHIEDFDGFKRAMTQALEKAD